MDERDLDRLADLIAREILRSQDAGPPPARPYGYTEREHVAAPVWNEPVHGVAPPPDAAVAARAAASRRGLGAAAPGATRRARPVALDPRAREIPIGVAPRYALLTDEDWRALFGAETPAVLRELRQPGQVAWRQTVRLIGPRGELDRIRVLGPFRQRSRVAITMTDARRLGIDAPVRLPGDSRDAPSATLVGPAGSRPVPVVIAAAHVHLSPDRAAQLGLRDGDRVAVRCGGAGRAITLHDVPVYVGAEHRPELHLDADEANAAAVRDGDLAMLVDLPGAAGHGRTAARGRRPLVTERDVAAFAARGEILSRHSPYLITPAARDRARELGIWRESP